MEMMVEDGETVRAALLRTTDRVGMPTCTTYRNYGKCKPEHKRNFLHGMNLFMKSTESEWVVFS